MKKITSILLFLFVASFANATVITEATLVELGYESFSISGANIEGCVEYSFAQAIDLNNAVYVVFSLRASFAPISEGDANITVYLNDGLDAVAELETDDFYNGWARVILPREGVGKRNTLRVCGATSFQITQIEILDDSKIGNYFMPDFSRIGSFTKLIAVEEPKIGEEFPIAVTLLNYGSEAADVFLRYRRETLDDAMPEIQVVKERTSLTATVPECQQRDEETNCIIPGEVHFEYTVKTTRAVQMTMLPAILRYTNIFGDEVFMESNRQTIRVVLPEIRIRAFILSNKDSLKIGEKNKVAVVVKNEGKDTLYNIAIRLDSPEELDIEGSTNMSIASINPDETREFDFNVNTNVPGSYKIGCDILYLDYNVVRTNCDPLTVSYEDLEVDPTIMAAGLLFIIGFIVYVYFSLKKV